MLRNLKVGIFDSGIGGLSVLSEMVTLMPNISITYIADDLFCPYGTKSEEEIVKRSNTIVKLLLNFDVDLVVVACNTATAWAIADLRSRYRTPFVGIEPFLNIKNHQEYAQVDGRFVVLTTTATGSSAKFKILKERLDPKQEIAHFCLPQLATFIEVAYKKGTDRELLAAIEKELMPLREGQFDYAILGCTHYPLISNKIESFLNVKTINPSQYVALRVKELLHQIDSVSLEKSVLVDQFTFLRTSCEQIERLDTGSFRSDKINLI